MKRSKLAAGALALALGLGAVAPVVEATAGQANAIFEEEFRKAEAKLVEKYKDVASKTEELKEAKEKAEAQYKVVKEVEAKIAAWEAEKKAAAEEVEYAKGLVKLYTEQLVTITDDGAGRNAQDDLDGAEKKLEEAEEVYASYETGSKYAERIELNKELGREKDKYTLLKGKQVLAEEALAKAKVELEAAKKAASEAGLSADEIARLEANYTVAKRPALPSKDEKPADKDDNKGVSEATLAQLEKVVAEAEYTIKAVKLLQDTTPQTIRNVADKLEALVAEQEKQLESARAILKANKKSALNVLFTTAYAADATAEEVDQLIKDIESSTDEINKVLKENEKEQEQEAKKEEEEQKPAEEEQKPAEDKKDEDKKDEEKKPAEANKKAGNNVKTGVAGVAGVAAVLAAASAAYVASKRD